MTVEGVMLSSCEGAAAAMSLLLPALCALALAPSAVAALVDQAFVATALAGTSPAAAAPTDPYIHLVS